MKGEEQGGGLEIFQSFLEHLEEELSRDFLMLRQANQIWIWTNPLLHQV
jgi:hypothetical protein